MLYKLLGRTARGSCQPSGAFQSSCRKQLAMQWIRGATQRYFASAGKMHI